MLSKYIQIAMEQAQYEILDDDQSYYGEITCLNGVWANTETLEKCREELKEVLEGWIILRLTKGLDIPELAGVALIAKEVV